MSLLGFHKYTKQIQIVNLFGDTCTGTLSGKSMLSQRIMDICSGGSNNYGSYMVGKQFYSLIKP